MDLDDDFSVWGGSHLQPLVANLVGCILAALLITMVTHHGDAPQGDSHGSTGSQVKNH